MVRGAISAITQVVPLFAMIATLVAYYLTGNPLQASIVFAALSLFYALRIPLLTIPMAVSMVTRSKVEY